MKLPPPTYGLDAANLRRASRARQIESWTPCWLILAGFFATFALIVGGVALADQLLKGT